jgi:hypothetical protein
VDGSLTMAFADQLSPLDVPVQSTLDFGLLCYTPGPMRNPTVLVLLLLVPASLDLLVRWRDEQPGWSHLLLRRSLAERAIPSSRVSFALVVSYARREDIL